MTEPDLQEEDVLTEKQASLLAKAEKAVDALLEALEV